MAESLGSLPGVECPNRCKNCEKGRLLQILVRTQSGLESNFLGFCQKDGSCIKVIQGGKRVIKGYIPDFDFLLPNEKTSIENGGLILDLDGRKIRNSIS